MVDMPLNSIPPTTTVDHLRSKREAALGQCWTDVAFWGGVIPGNEVFFLRHMYCLKRKHLNEHDSTAAPQTVGRRWSQGLQMLSHREWR